MRTPRVSSLAGCCFHARNGHHPPPRHAPGAPQAQQPVHSLLLVVPSFPLTHLHKVLCGGHAGARSRSIPPPRPPPPGKAPSPPCSGQWAASSRSCSLCGGRVRASGSSQPRPGPCPSVPAAPPTQRAPDPAGRTHSAAMSASCSACLTAASSSSRLSPAPSARPLAYQVRSRPFCQRPTGAMSELPAGMQRPVLGPRGRRDCRIAPVSAPVALAPPLSKPAIPCTRGPRVPSFRAPAAPPSQFSAPAIPRAPVPSHPRPSRPWFHPPPHTLGPGRRADPGSSLSVCRSSHPPS